jgi:hypothetical protein
MGFKARKQKHERTDWIPMALSLAEIAIRTGGEFHYERKDGCQVSIDPQDLDSCETCGKPTDGAICDPCRERFEREVKDRDHVLDYIELLALRAALKGDE